MNGLGKNHMLTECHKDPLEFMVMNLTEISQCGGAFFCPLIIGYQDAGSE